MSSIWDMVGEKSGPTDNEFTIVVVGNKESGKTSIINRFVEKNETPKPTLAMEYLYARRNRATDSRKDVCHIWELGGGTVFGHLLEIPLSPDKLHLTSIAVVLDLSQPEELWIVFETLTKKLRSHLNKAMSLSVNFENTKEPLMERAWKRIGEDHADRDFISPLPIPMLIIGSKYDLFENTEPEARKIICRTLRFLAHINGAALHFASVKTENLMSKCKSTLSHLAFQNLSSKTCVIDYTKPVIVPFGGDSMQLIGGVNSADEHQGKSIERCMELWRNYFSSHFPQVTKKVGIPDDPGKDPNFQEKDIDLIKAQKDRELEEFRRHQPRKYSDGFMS